MKKRNKTAANNKTKRKNVKITIIAVIFSALCLLICCVFTLYLSDWPAFFTDHKEAAATTGSSSVSVDIPYQTAQTAIEKGISCPYAKVIYSPEDFSDYSAAYDDAFDFGDISMADSFMQIAGSYGANFFSDNIIVLVALSDNISTFYPSSCYIDEFNCLNVKILQNADLYDGNYVKGGHIFIEMQRPSEDISLVNVII